MPERWLPNPPPYPPSPPLDWPPGSEPPPPEAPAVDAPQSGGMPLAAVVVGVALLAALATFGLLLLLRPPKKRVVTVSPTTVTPSTAPTTVPGPTTSTPDGQVLTRAQLARALPGFIAFVEQHRGLKFKSTPAVVLDTVPTYLSAWHTYLRSDKPLLTHLDVVMTAFGLNPSNTDLVQAQQTWLGDGTVAFYDPATKVLHVRTAPYTSYVKQTIVGMLTRALDDQWFSIGRLDPSKGLGEPQFGLATLVSGDQQRIGNTWLSTQSYDEQQNAEAEAADRTPNVSDPRQVPVSLARWLSSPDNAGPDLVQAILDQGGRAALDAAFRTPPGGSQQSLDPTRDVAGEKPLAVPPPAPGATPTASGSFGQLLIQDAFTDNVDSDLLSQAMDGYRGDATVAWTSQGQSCARIRLASVDRESTTEMAQAVTQWANRVKATFVIIADPTRPGQSLVEATVCHAGGGGGGSPSTTTPGPGGPPGTSPGQGPSI